jgi:hypothetical protein
VVNVHKSKCLKYNILFRDKCKNMKESNVIYSETKIKTAMANGKLFKTYFVKVVNLAKNRKGHSGSICHAELT